MVTPSRGRSGRYQLPPSGRPVVTVAGLAGALLGLSAGAAPALGVAAVWAASAAVLAGLGGVGQVFGRHRVVVDYEKAWRFLRRYHSHLLAESACTTNDQVRAVGGRGRT
jgi:hypothetical protein